MHHNGHSKAWSFSEFCIAVNDGFEYHLLEMGFYFLYNLFGEIQAVIVHGKENSFNVKRRIQPGLNVQARLNPALDIEGILLTMYDNRLNLAKQVVEEVKTHFQQMVFKTIINRNTKLGEAPSFGVTIMMHDINSSGAVNYLNLAREVLQNNELTRLKNEEKEINV